LEEKPFKAFQPEINKALLSDTSEGAVGLGAGGVLPTPITETKENKHQAIAEETRAAENRNSR